MIEKKFEAIDTEKICGIAKKLSKELEELPLHTHAAVIAMLNVTAQHRGENEKFKMQLAQQEAREKAVQQQIENERKANAAAQTGLGLVKP